ncbi:MAG: peptidoglycan editing factor PgeF [Helicobacteraceae bacterium]|nr:peptidoglycan editing factor PgeF [Helicobacteraceae bacterium]
MKNIISFFSSKEDGNLAFHVNDDKNSVICNHKMLALKLGYDHAKLVHMKQVHSNRVVVVDNSFNFNTPPICDALITNKKNLPLMVMVADCTPILLYDRKKSAIAVVHAGREGAFKNILKETIFKMKNEFNTDSNDLEVVLGPSIKKCCYEIGSKMAKENSEFEYAIDEMYYLHIDKILLKQLNELGVENIKISNSCSCCESKTLYSYRAEGVKAGRMAGVIMLK